MTSVVELSFTHIIWDGSYKWKLTNTIQDILHFQIVIYSMLDARRNFAPSFLKQLEFQELINLEHKVW